MEFSDLNIICVCEGTAEYEIMKILLDNNFLVFGYDALVDNRLYKRRQKNNIISSLQYRFRKEPILLSVRDKKNEVVKFGKCLDSKYELVNLITSPEIEVLVLSNEGYYVKWHKSNISKPSVYCKDKLGYRHVKSAKFIKDYFTPNVLLASIRAYNSDHKQPKGTIGFWDILRDEYKYDI